MANPAHIPDHASDGQLGTCPHLDEDDEPICTTPHRQLIAELGRQARAEQERLEQELGRTPRPNRTPGGYFP